MFPEFIDVSDNEIVKFTLLSIVRKRYWRKKENEGEIRLLPISFKNVSEDPKYYMNKGLDKFNYAITFRRHRLFTMHLIERDLASNPSGNLPRVFFSDKTHPWGLKLYVTDSSKIKFMSKEEITNWKRDILIENMIK